MFRSGSILHKATLILAIGCVLVLSAATPCLAEGGTTKGGVKVEAIPKGDRRKGLAAKLPAHASAAEGEAGPVWYLAEGSDNWGFETAIAIENPNDDAVTLRITYMTTGGPIVKPDFQLKGASVVYIRPAKDIGHQDYSTRVECLEGLPIAVDRTMNWYNGGLFENKVGTHYSIGVTSPSNQWYLPEGSTGGSFETFILVQNPSDQTVQVRVNYMTPSGPGGVVTLDMAPNSRKTVNVADTVPNTWSVSTWVTCADTPVIAERAMYWDHRTEGHDSIGTSTPANTWLLSEGCTGGDFETWVLVQNPNSYPVVAKYSYMTNNGLYAGDDVQLAPFSRATVYVNEQMPGEWEVSTIVQCDSPIIAERSMYGGNRLWGTDSIGMDAAHDAILLPGGGTYNGWETWVLVQNPYNTAADIDVYYLTDADSPQNYHFSDTLPAYTRRSYNMGDVIGTDNEAGTLVICNTAGVKIDAEQANYLRDANGTRVAAGDTIGGYIDF
jgi:hypothetical protein